MFKRLCDIVDETPITEEYDGIKEDYERIRGRYSGWRKIRRIIGIGSEDCDTLLSYISTLVQMPYNSDDLHLKIDNLKDEIFDFLSSFPNDELQKTKYRKIL